MTHPLQLLQEAENLLALRQTARAFDMTVALLGTLRAEYHTRQVSDTSYTGDAAFWQFSLCSRVARVWGDVLLDPAFDPRSSSTYLGLLGNLSLVHALAHGTAEGNLDTQMRRLSVQQGGTHTPASLARFLLLWTPGSRLGFDPATVYVHAQELVVAQAIATVGGMVMATPETDRARTAAINFLNSATPSPEDYRRVGISTALYDAWMRCTYAPDLGKERIKRFLNPVILQLELRDYPVQQRARPASGKPVMVVPLEAFDSAHAMFRCYGPALAACRQHFHLVALAERRALDATAAAIFDHVHYVDEECMVDGGLSIAAVEALAKSYQPDVMLYPSVGMALFPLVLANRRIAPLQAMLYGHPATTWSACMDVGFAEQQFLGRDDDFSERVVALPRGSWSYLLPPNASYPSAREEHADDTVRIAVPSVAQKWTSGLIQCLAEVNRRAQRPVEFHLFSGLHNMYLPAAINAVQRFLPQAVVHPFMSYADYLTRLRQCSFHASTFPVGGMNSVIDSLICGLPVVCLAGQRIHARVDEDFVRRVGMPEWLIGETPAAYIDAQVRLINAPDELAALRHDLRDTGRTKKALFTPGDDDQLANALLAELLASRSRDAAARSTRT